MLHRSGCWQEATWQRGRPRPRAGWRRRLATSLCASLRALCAVLGPSRALAYSCRSAGLLTLHDQTLPECVLQQSSGLTTGIAGVVFATACSIREAFWKFSRSALQAPDPVQNHTEGSCSNSIAFCRRAGSGGGTLRRRLQPPRWWQPWRSTAPWRRQRSWCWRAAAQQLQTLQDTSEQLPAPLTLCTTVCARTVSGCLQSVCMHLPHGGPWSRKMLHDTLRAPESLFRSCVCAGRYGPDAAEITGHATEMATQSATAAMRLRTGGVKTIAQRVARHTALGFARQAVYGPAGKQGGQGQPPSKPGPRPQVS